MASYIYYYFKYMKAVFNNKYIILKLQIGPLSSVLILIFFSFIGHVVSEWELLAEK